MPKHVIGQYPQRQLVQVLKTLIDAAMAPNSTAHRDQSRQELRHLLETENWRTTHVLGNIGPTRCKYIASIGFWVSGHFTLTDWKRRPGEEPKDVEYE